MRCPPPEEDDFKDPRSAKPKSFRPYFGASLDTPWFHIVVEPLLPLLRPLLQLVFSIRSQLSRPFQIRLLPSFCPRVDLPVLRDLVFLTLGGVLLAVPLMIIFLGGYYFTFVSPDIVRSGNYASYAMYATFLTANKTNSIFAFLFGIPFERMLPYHNLSALVTVTLSCFHGYVAYAYGSGESSEQDTGNRRLDSSDEGFNSGDGGSSQHGLLGTDPNLGKFLFDDDYNTSGTLLAIAMATLVLTSIFPWLRRNAFNLWLLVHILAAVCTIVFATMHEVTSILAVGAWWVIDLLTRYLVMAACRYPHWATLAIVHDDVVRITFPKTASFSYNCGQFVQIAVRDLGVLEFHPISISSAPHEEEVTLHVRARGDWSKRLLELAKLKQEVVILLEGPYGSLSVDIDDDQRYKMVLLVSGGIGVTNCSSIAKSLIHDFKGGRKLKHLRFVWTVRDLEFLDVMEPLEVPPSDSRLNGSSADLRTATMHMLSSSALESLEMQYQPVKPAVVETDIFLTRSSPGAPVCLSDGRNIFFGRPDLDKIVADMKEKALKRKVSHVAVFGCGPDVLIADLKEVCRKHSRGVTEARGVTFDVHEEIFDF